MDIIACSLVTFLTLVASVAPSAIPMWELLSRPEKMSHLFNMFTKQVSEHCDTSTMPDCNKVLMVHGLTNLAKMEDDSLDKMDPYQRGAMDIIWDHMMDLKSSGAQPTKENAYNNEPVTSDNQLGAASSNSEQYLGSAHYVMGPMVVRVYPDGRPVPDDVAKPLPKDEDAQEFLAMRSKHVPSVEDLVAHHRSNPPARISQLSYRQTQ